MQSIISKLYSGDIAERIDEMTEDEKIESKEKIVDNEMDYWRDKLPRSEFRRLEDKIIYNCNDINALVMKSSFVNGFKLGMQLLIEALYE